MVTHHNISLTDSKNRTALLVSIIDSGSERDNWNPDMILFLGKSCFQCSCCHLLTLMWSLTKGKVGCDC